ncbi:MAG: RND family transporter [SAR324 cluster bacterium]|nr:RND family transporter [SAR324 cluster bacterium]
MLRQFYDKLVLKYPVSVAVILLITIASLGYQARKLEVDASAETLVLEDDADLRLTRIINERYGSPDFLVITYSPQEELLTENTLNQLRGLKKDLLRLQSVESVISILDVPLLESPPRPIKELLKAVPTLESAGIDKKLAKEEFLNSPIYRDLLVSPDFRTTAMQVNLHQDEIYKDLLKRRNLLKQKAKDDTITPGEKTELLEVQAEFKKHRDKMRLIQHQTILDVRAILDNYRDGGRLFLGGVSMVADDLVTYVKDDLRLFGIVVFLFLIITLGIIFRQLRWILLPILCCSFSVLATCGFLGLFGWEVTIISSNFISLQLIITMAITIHLIVRYRELIRINPEADQHQLVLDTVLAMAKPCLYTTLTTIAGFSSLVLSGILPVINFGWMMSVGTGISLLLTFLIFPVLVVMLKKLPPNVSFESKFALTKPLAQFTEQYGKWILWVSAAVLVVSIIGTSRLMVENSFIDYFKKSTEIYQGMKVIDQELGGTTPFEVILDFEEEALPQAADVKENKAKDAFDAFEEEFAESKDEPKYWFTSEKMEQISKVHDYLDRLPETGKVLSLATMLKVGKTLNNGKPLDNFLLALIYNELPERFRKIVLSPYVSVENNQVRFSVLVRDSEPNLRRNELLKRIKNDLKSKLELEEDRYHLVGLLVLYNNMLQSLFNSQILTLGAVIGALLIMFLILFRSLKISLIAIFPNILSIGTVLGFMGWAKIPLDMMTITIAAISVGIAVDNTIHYIHRFMNEFPKDRNYIATMHRCHGSIGYAMYYTSITIIIGFSILVLSAFIPTIYFGLLTGLAMIIALIAALTLLPQLMVFLKPLGAEAK